VTNPSCQSHKRGLNFEYITMQMTRKLVKAQDNLLRPIAQKWQDVIPRTFLLDWKKSLDIMKV
jgi:hypothetical protein